MDIYYGVQQLPEGGRFRQRLAAAESELNGQMPLPAFDNHDQRRSWDRYGDGAHDESIAKAIAALLLVMPRATALLYYGQEIGTRITIQRQKRTCAIPMGRTGWPREIGRDGERTPMQWNAAKTPVSAMPLRPGSRSDQISGCEMWRSSRTSLIFSPLSYYKTLIQLKRENAALHQRLSYDRRKGNPSVLSWICEG